MVDMIYKEVPMAAYGPVKTAFIYITMRDGSLVGGF